MCITRQFRKKRSTASRQRCRLAVSSGIAIPRFPTGGEGKDMRLLFCAPLLASMLTAAGSPDDWITKAGGTVTRDGSGRVVSVNLHASWVTDSDIAELAKLPALTKLDLSMTRITDRGLL